MTGPVLTVAVVTATVILAAFLAVVALFTGRAGPALLASGSAGLAAATLRLWLTAAVLCAAAGLFCYRWLVEETADRERRRAR
jgi:membrane protease YdiL (CAAX protease family)